MALAYINASFHLASFSIFLLFARVLVLFNVATIQFNCTMNQQSPKEKAEALIGALEKYGQGDYIGESISQLEHCLQAAHQAHKAGTYYSQDLS